MKVRIGEFNSRNYREERYRVAGRDISSLSKASQGVPIALDRCSIPFVDNQYLGAGDGIDRIHIVGGDRGSSWFTSVRRGYLCSWPTIHNEQDRGGEVLSPRAVETPIPPLDYFDGSCDNLNRSESRFPGHSVDRRFGVCCLLVGSPTGEHYRGSEVPGCVESKLATCSRGMVASVWDHHGVSDPGFRANYVAQPPVCNCVERCGVFWRLPPSIHRRIGRWHGSSSFAGDRMDTFVLRPTGQERRL